MADTDVESRASWEQEFPGEPASIAPIRRGVADHARAAGADETQLADLTLAVSEAATNAVVHGFADSGPGTIRIRATAGDDTFSVIVADDGRGMKPRGDSPGLGLGLPTIAQLTSSFDIRDGPGGVGTEVHMVFTLPGVRAPRTAVDREAWRFELLAEVAYLTGTGWPAKGADRLLDLLVPAVADAGVIDLVEAAGPRRAAALGPHPSDEALQSALPALRHGEVHVVELAEDPEHAWWVNVPMTENGILLGSLGLGLNRERPRPDGELPFYAALGERAARGLASTHLVDELRRTRRRLERILSVLSEAVTVQDGEGRVVYANDAAAALLGAQSLEEIVMARPGELAARFHITREDGRAVEHADLPGDRVLAGEETASLLTRSVLRETGTERWLLTKSTLLEDGEPFAVNIIEDITEAKNSELRRRLLAEAGELLAAADRDGVLPGLAALMVPALADWSEIDLGDGRTAQAGEVGARRSDITVAIGERGTLRLATGDGLRALSDDHRAFAQQLADRLAAGLLA